MKNLIGEEVYFEDVERMIMTADGAELREILDAVKLRHAQLYPQWELALVSVEKAVSCEEQLETISAVLKKLQCQA